MFTKLILSSPHWFTHTSCSTLCLSSVETGSCHNARVTWSQKHQCLFSSSGSHHSAHIHTATITPPSSVKTPLCSIFLDFSRASTELFLCTDPTASVKNSLVEPFSSPAVIRRPCREPPGWQADRAERKANQVSGLFISLLFSVCFIGMRPRCQSDKTLCQCICGTIGAAAAAAATLLFERSHCSIMFHIDSFSKRVTIIFSSIALSL